jgi:hypothetical protein
MGKVKSMLIIFFDINGIVRKKFVLAGKAASSAYYCEVLLRLRENVRRQSPKIWLFHHANAAPHTSFFT